MNSFLDFLGGVAASFWVLTLLGYIEGMCYRIPRDKGPCKDCPDTNLVQCCRWDHIEVSVLKAYRQGQSTLMAIGAASLSFLYFFLSARLPS